MTARSSFEARVLCAPLAVALGACAPELTDETTLVTAPRVLAAIADPPELHPRETVQVRVFPAPSARGATPQLTFCTTPPTVGDPRPVSDACLTEKGVPLSVTGLTASGMVPADACALFGPDPVTMDDRPRDPDATGGFYQPVRISLFGETSIESLRIQCTLPDAPADLARDFADRYRPNRNPAEPALERDTPDGWQTLSAVKPRESVRVRVRWDAGSREAYVYLPPGGSALVERTESMSVSWFSSAGSFAESVTGRAEQDPRNDTINSFVAPADGAFTVWMVLRDGRGGSAFVTRSVHVEGR